MQRNRPRPPDGELPEAFRVLWPYGPAHTIRRTSEDDPQRAAHVESVLLKRGVLQGQLPLRDSSTGT